MRSMISNKISGTSCSQFRRVAYGLLLLLLIVQIEGCYYMQAARGQINIMHKRRPVDEVIQDADSPDALKERLELYLPDNDSYRSYADLERDFVVWNVFAAPEFSLHPKQWCYPVVGCVSYRGYFSQEAAERQAGKLRAKHYDVVVGGVTAYSTLGRFADPVLNTMMRWSEIDLVAVLFHELAHQQLYIKDDSEFNESFATAVEEFGIELWLTSRDETDRLGEYRSSREFRQRLMEHVQSARVELQKLYGSSVDEREKQEQKQTILTALREVAGQEVDRTGRRAPGWLGAPLNNASLIPLTLYQGRLTEFRELLMECDEDLHCFYARAEALAK